MSRRLTAEFEPQKGVLLTWPHTYSDWHPTLAPVELCYTALITAIAENQSVLVICYDETHLAQAKTALKDANLNNIHWAILRTNDTWCRDYGPIRITEWGKNALLNFEFNGWGNKYPSALDNAVNQQLASQGAWGAAPLMNVPLILEGGAIETDGQGTLLTTTRCLKTRLPELTLQQIANTLHEVFNIKRILWLDNGALEGDDTDGHIDMLARFCDPETIAYLHCDDPLHPNYTELHKMAQALASFKTQEQKPYRLIPLPVPPLCYTQDGQPLPLSYANFLILNEAVLVPVYQQPEDTLALAEIQKAFMGRKIYPIDALALVAQGGSIHCATKEF